MIKLTLDTNCIINLLDYKSDSAMSVDELAEIVRYGFEGDVNIAITTRVDSDINEDKNQERKNEMLRRISMFSVIGTVARLGNTKWGNGDVFSGEDHQKLEDELIKIIFPSLKKGDPHFTNKINDIDHLIGHKIHGRDIFVTDDRQILKKAETLKTSIGIEVMDPKKVLEYINLQANKVVLVQEFSEKFDEYKKIVLFATKGEDISDAEMEKFEELRKWMVRKLPVINDGFLKFKLQMLSIPTGGQRVFEQNDISSLQMFNDRFNGILKERDPFQIREIASTHRHDYDGYKSEREKIELTIEFLNSVEDSLLGYMGALESY